MPFLQLADDGLEAGHVRPVLIDRDGVPLGIDPGGRSFEERLAGEEDHLCLIEVPDQRRIQEALVVRCDEDGPFRNEIFLTDNTHPEDGAERSSE